MALSTYINISIVVVCLGIIGYVIFVDMNRELSAKKTSRTFIFNRNAEVVEHYTIYYSVTCIQEKNRHKYIVKNRSAVSHD